VIPLAEIVDAGALAKTAAAALLAGTGVTLLFSLAIVGLTRSGELRDSGRSVMATLAMVLGVIALIASIAAVGLGLVVMIAG
jgi:hypothetical protein